MSNKARDWARSLPLASASEKAVLKELGDRADEKTNECFPGLDQLAFDTALSTRTVTAALKGLEGKGLISRRRRYRGYQNRISGDIYLVHVGTSVDDERKTRKPRGKPPVAASAVRLEDDSSPANIAGHANNPVSQAAVAANSAAHEETPSGANDAANFAAHEPSSVATVAAGVANFAPALTEEPPVNPQSSSVPGVPQERARQFDGDVDEDLYLGLPQPELDDDDDFGIDEPTRQLLRGIDQRIDPVLLVGRLRSAGIDTARLNLLRAVTDVWSRHSPSKGPIADPVAFLSTAIEKECTNPDWAKARPGHGYAAAPGIPSTSICDTEGHLFTGAFKAFCARCDAERPGWREDRDRHDHEHDVALAAEGANAR